MAEYVFAPHYSAPLLMIAERAADLRDGPEETAAVIATLAPGDLFEALDFATASAWGTAPGSGLVGYVDRNALGLASEPR